MPFDVGRALGIWLLMRCCGVPLILHLLHALLHTATRRKERSYLKNVSLPERYFGGYMLRITDFKRPLVRFLIVFHAVCFAVSCLLLCLWLADLLADGAIAARIPAFHFEIVCAVPLLVPLLVDLALTVYPDGHPHFRFDAYAPAIRPRDKARVKRLLDEARARLRFTPEQFAQWQTKRRNSAPRRGK